MKIENGTFTRNANGNCTVILNDATLTADLILFFLASSGTSDSVCHINIGFMHANGYGGVSAFDDSTGGKSRQNNAAKALSHEARVSGTLTNIIQATGNGISTGDFTLNFTANSSTYPIGFLAIQF